MTSPDLISYFFSFIAYAIQRTTIAGMVSLVSSHGVRDKAIETGKIRVHVSTWNMHAKNPPEDLTVLYNGVHHIFAVGSQECEHTIAESIIYRDKSNWERQVKRALGINFVMLRSHTLQAINLMIFVHRSLLPLISNVQSATVATGIGNTLGNKGGVGIAFQILERKLLFINCHFQAHVRNL